MSQRPFEDYLHNKTEEFQLSPNPDNWDKIASALPAEKKKKKGLIILFSGLAACLTLALILVIHRTDRPTEDLASINSTVSPSTNGLRKANVPEQLAHQQDSFVTHSISSSTPESDPHTSNNLEDKNSSKPETHQKTTTDNLNRWSKNHNDFGSRQAKSLEPQGSEVQIATALKSANGSNNHSTINPGPKQNILQDLGVTSAGQLDKLPIIDDESTHAPANNSNPGTDTMDNPKVAFAPEDASGASDSIVPTVNNDKTVPPKKSPWSGFVEFEGFVHKTQSQITLAKSYRDIEPYQSDYNNRKKEDKAKVNTYFGLHFGLRYKNHQLKLGVRYMNVSHTMTVINVTNSILSGTSNRYSTFNYNNSDSFLTESFDFSGSNVVSPPPRESIGTVVNTYKFLSVPIGYSYNFKLGKRLNLSPEFSFAFNRLLYHQGLVHSENSDVYVKPENYTDNHITKSHLSLGLGMEIRYQILKSLELGINYRYISALTPIEKSVVRTSYISSGLGFTIRYNFYRN